MQTQKERTEVYSRIVMQSWAGLGDVLLKAPQLICMFTYQIDVQADQNKNIVPCSVVD